MEVRVIDPKSESSENAGRVLGTVIRVVPSPKRPPAPNPYRFLIRRALNQNAGKTDKQASSSHKTMNPIFVGSPATNHREEAGKSVGKARKVGDVGLPSRSMTGPIPGKLAECDSLHGPDPSIKREVDNQWKHQRFGTPQRKRICRNEDQEAKGGLAQAGLSGMSHGQATGQTQVVGPRSIPASQSQNYCINNGTPIKINQHAEVAGHKLFLLRKTNCGEGISFPSVQNSPSRHPAPNPNEQNAGNSRKASPPRLESKSPCASRSSKPSEVIVGHHKFFSPFRRLFSYIWSKSAFNDPTREMTNWGWRRKT